MVVIELSSMPFDCDSCFFVGEKRSVVLEQHKISFTSFRNFCPLMQYNKKFIPLLVL